MMAVDIHITLMANSIEQDRNDFSIIRARKFELFSVPAYASGKMGGRASHFFIEAQFYTPVMGELYPFPTLVIIGSVSILLIITQ